MAGSIMRNIFYKFSRCKYNYFQKKIDIKWQKLYPYNEICKDGILIYEKYYATKPKIMFLLKEPADGFYIKRESPKGSYGPYGNSGRFWRHMRMWTYIIRKYYHKKIPNYSKAESIKEEENISIAYVNIVKENDNAYSDQHILEEYIKNKKHKKLLINQLRIIKPDVIICGGTFKYLKAIFGTKIIKQNFKLYKFKKIKIIDFCHPSCFIGNYLKYFNKLSNISKNMWVSATVPEDTL